MQPIHQGLPNVGLYNGNAFQTVGVCLDSGLIATAACKNDARGIDRVSYANCYAEDRPAGTCNKHTSVEYCVSGGGVATEYCHLFAEHEDVKIESRSLVKLSRAEVEEIKQARYYGLNEQYYDDGYVYYLDGAWHGFDGNANDGVDEPYLVCPEHTREAWEEYEAQQEETEPEDEGLVDGSGNEGGTGNEDGGNSGGNNEGLIGGGLF